MRSANELQINIACIDQELKDLKAHIHHFRSTLNDEGVWLFLCTLGCWGVTNPIIQFFSYGLAVLLFGKRTSDKIHESRSFSAMVKSIEKKAYELLPEGETQDSKLYALILIQKRDLAFLATIKKSSIFICCWLFYAASFGHSLIHL